MSKGAMGRRCGLLMVALCSTVMAAASARAAESVDWTIARRSDASILDLSKTLDARLAGMPQLANERALVLFRSNVWDIYERGHKIIWNEMVLVRDPKHETASTREFPVDPEAGLDYHAAWIQRDGKIIRLKEDVWTIIKGNEDKMTSVVVAFPDVRSGDVLGWSLELKCSWFYGGGYMAMACDLPVMMCRTRVKSADDIGYRLSGEHLRRDGWSSKVIDEAHGAPTDVSLTVIDIPERPHGPYAPGFFEYEPYLFATYRGYWRKDAGRWICNVSWNEVAIEASGLIDHLDGKTSEVKAEADRIVGAATSPTEKALALDRFVRDRIVILDPFLIRSRKGDMASILATRQATPNEAAVLLYVMCRAVGVEADLLGSRSLDLTPIDMANPSFANLTQIVVRVSGQPNLYLTPYDEYNVPGSLPAYLRGAQALEFPRGIKDEFERIGKQALVNAGAHPTLWVDEYNRLMKQENLARWVTLPGDPDRVMAETKEVVRRRVDSDEAEIDVTLSGLAMQSQRIDGHQEATDILRGYWARRFGDATVVNATWEPAAENLKESRLAGVAKAPALPPPLDNDWVIPGELIFGREFLDDWNAGSKEPFINRAVADRRLTWRLVLPADWQPVLLPRELSINHPQFSYRCVIRIVEGELVVHRDIRFHRQLTMFDDLASFRAEIEKVRAFESAAVVVSRG